MKKLFYIAAFAILFSCQIEDDNAPKPEESFIKYLGEIADQEAKDIEPIYAADGVTLEGFVIFGTQKQADSVDTDYYLVRTDPFGNIEETAIIDPNTAVEGLDLDGNGQDDVLTGNEIAGQIEVLPGGGFIAIGSTSVTDQSKDLTDFRFISLVVLDAELNVLRVVTAFNENATGTAPLNLDGNDIIVLSDGSILIVGAIETAAGDTDYYYRKLNGDTDAVTFTKTLGLAGASNDDVLVRAFETDKQTIALFGYSQRVGNAGQIGTNVSYVEVNQNGNPTGGSGNFGIPDTLDGSNVLRVFNDVLTDVVEKPGGYMAVGTATVDATSFAFFMDIDFDGISSRKGRLLSEFDPALTTAASGVSITRTNDFVVVGQYTNFRVGNEQRGEEAMFQRINQVGEKVEGFESNYGLGDGNDNAADVITLADGKIVVATTIDFGGGIRMIGLIKLNDTGELDR
ncbi:MAG: hypothetical protein ABJP45_15890 [Cyclobacteriaceae bacterium]